MLADRALETGRKPEARCAVTNRRNLFLNETNNPIDERSVFARRFHDVLALHVSDLGGWDCISEAQASVARRAATITVTCEQLESRMAVLEEPDTGLADLYSRLSNTLRRLLQDLGFERRAKDVTPSLSKLLTEAKTTRAAK